MRPGEARLGLVLFVTGAFLTAASLAQDADGDGALEITGEFADNCPGLPNPGQENLDCDRMGDACDGDDDGDGRADVGPPGERDDCPGIKNPDFDGDGSADPWPDADGDGLGDVCDNCRITPNAEQADGDDDGLGDACDPDAGDNSVEHLVSGGVKTLLESAIVAGAGEAQVAYWDTVALSVAAVQALAAEALLLADALALSDPADRDRIALVVRGVTQFLLDKQCPGGACDPEPPCDFEDEWSFYTLRFFLRLRELDRVPRGKEALVSQATELVIRRLEGCLATSAHQGITRYCGLEASSCGTAQGLLECHGGAAAALPAPAVSCPRSVQCTFMTAPALLCLFAAREAGYAVGEAAAALGVQALSCARMRGEIDVDPERPFPLLGPHPGAYTYTDRNVSEPYSFACRRATVPGSISRAPLAEAALRVWLGPDALPGGGGTLDGIRRAVEAFFEGEAVVDSSGTVRRIQDLLDRARECCEHHEGPFGLATWYVAHAYHGVAVAIGYLPREEQTQWLPSLRRAIRRARMAPMKCDDNAQRLLCTTGFCWNDQDQAIWPRAAAYGTAMALLALMADRVYPIARSGPKPFRRGDANLDGDVDVSDATAVVLHLYRGLYLACQDAADADDDGAIGITDAVYLLSFLFRGAPEPPSPGPGVIGADPTADGLGCLYYASS